MYKNIISIDEKGQIIIPKFIRSKLKLRNKDKIIFTTNKEYIILKKIESKEDIIINK